MFACSTLQHEQTFGVNRFVERLFVAHATTLKVGCDIGGRDPVVALVVGVMTPPRMRHPASWRRPRRTLMLPVINAASLAVITCESTQDAIKGGHGKAQPRDGVTPTL